MSGLAVSTILLWGVTVALALAVLVLTRQIGLLHERISPAVAPLRSRAPLTGSAAPRIPVQLFDSGERTVGDPDPTGRSLLLCFVSPTCAVCGSLLPVLASIGADERTPCDVLLVSAGSRDEHERFLADRSLDPAHFAVSPELGLVYAVSRLPHAVLIDGSGVIRGQGHVNTPDHLESLFESKEHNVSPIHEFLNRSEGTKGAA